MEKQQSTKTVHKNLFFFRSTNLLSNQDDGHFKFRIQKK